MKTLTATLFFLTSAFALAMDDDDKKLVQSAHPPRAIFEEIFPDVIKSHLLPWLDLNGFSAFMQTCKTAYKLTNQGENPDLYLPSDPKALIQQLRGLIPLDGKANLNNLLSQAIRTKGADELLFNAGFSYFSENKEPERYEVTLNETWRPYGFALCLAEAMGITRTFENQGIRIGPLSHIRRENGFLLDTQRDEAWRFFFFSFPKNYFQAGQIDSYEMACKFAYFGNEWIFTRKKKYEDFINTMKKYEFNRGFYKVFNDFNDCLKSYHESPEAQKAWLLCAETARQINERYLQHTVEPLKKKRAELEMLDADSNPEKVAAFSQEIADLRGGIRLVAHTTYQYDHSAYLSDPTAKVAYELKKAAIYHETEDKSKEGDAYYKAGIYMKEIFPGTLDAKREKYNYEALSYFLKAIDCFREAEEAFEETYQQNPSAIPPKKYLKKSSRIKEKKGLAYSQAAPLYKNIPVTIEYFKKAMDLLILNNSHAYYECKKWMTFYTKRLEKEQ